MVGHIIGKENLIITEKMGEGDAEAQHSKQDENEKVCKKKRLVERHDRPRHLARHIMMMMRKIISIK